MFIYAWLKRLLRRKLLSLVLLSYFLMILLFFMNMDFADPQPNPEESFSLIFPDATFYTRRDSQNANVNHSSPGQRKHNSETFLKVLNSVDQVGVGRINAALGNRKIKVKFQEPIPLLEPFLDKKIRSGKSGDFISFGEGAYVYSAFLDDRKEQTFVRIMTLVSQQAATQFIYCHFNDTTNDLPKRSEIYQLCENHSKVYGGYFYSCEVPENSKHIQQFTSVVISFTETGPRVKVPLQLVRPSDDKTRFLDVYPRGSYVADNSKMNSINIKLNVPSNQVDDNSSQNKSKKSPLNPSLSFAICVSPLFGNISVHRLVEFVELSRLLGAEHFIFYNHSVPPQVSDALRYYMNQNIASVLPWSLPPEVDSVWYYGQLLANNDCLYRTMPHFDLVSFNDIDEFIVPHSNASTWKEAFSPLLTQDRCGFSFQSAFYDPSIREPFESTLLTPVLISKSEMFSKVRTKVMVCPWRVFEVGIHHISKQNREDWRSYGVHPSVAYLHHYRRCVANYGMRCSSWEKDFTIADRYLEKLTVNYEKVLNILFPQNTRYSISHKMFVAHANDY